MSTSMAEYDKLFLALLAVSSAHAEASRQMFNELGLTEGQPKILYILNGQDEPIVQKDLADLCKVRQPTLTVLLSKLKEKNLISKESCLISGGKKAYKVYLTNEGRNVAKQLEQKVEHLEKTGFGGFSEDEKRQLLNMLGRVEINLKGQ